MAKRQFIRKQKRKRHGTTFWDHEYASEGGNLKLSHDQSEDLEKFTRWLRRQKNALQLKKGVGVLDIGCGNGRNLIYLAREFGITGVGYDISSAAISQAITYSKGLPITYTVRSVAGPLDIKPESQTFVLDMMTSHFLSETERETMLEEVHNALLPGGWFYLKTFLRDGDLHTERLLREHAGKEEGTYVHPVIGVPEHVYSEDEILKFISQKFKVKKVYRSHKHRLKGKARKRRTISVYAEKDPFL